MYPMLCEYTRLYNSTFKKHLAKNSFYLCNYARVSERSARRDFLSFKRVAHQMYICVYTIEVKQQSI